MSIWKIYFRSGRPCVCRRRLGVKRAGLRFGPCERGEAAGVGARRFTRSIRETRYTMDEIGGVAARRPISAISKKTTNGIVTEEKRMRKRIVKAKYSHGSKSTSKSTPGSSAICARSRSRKTNYATVAGRQIQNRVLAVHDDSRYGDEICIVRSSRYDKRIAMAACSRLQFRILEACSTFCGRQH